MRLLIFTMHGTTPWWTYLGANVEFAQATVLSDARGDGDADVVDDFYRNYRAGNAASVARAVYGADGLDDIIRRCRVLRGIDRQQAADMVGAMHQALSQAFDRSKPDICLSFTIDRYVMDLMARIGAARQVPFIEMTASIIPNEVMFMQRGRLLQLWQPTDEEVDARTAVLHTPDFAPSYVLNSRRFGPMRYWQIYGYFALRGATFNAIRYWQRDPLNLHYLDARKNLPHKPRVADAAVLGMLDRQWRDRLESVPREKRVFLGLQLFPEASLDYWLRDRAMLEHDDVMLKYCEVLGARGFHLFVKDHPLQFGFRQRELLQRLRAKPNVTLVPYEVPAQLLLAECSVSLTQTGTIGFQAALAGLCSVVSEPYYSTPDHYIHCRTAAQIEDIVDRIVDWRRPDDMVGARRKLVRHLAGGSVPGDYFAFRRFDASIDTHRKAVEPLLGTLNLHLRSLAAMR